MEPEKLEEYKGSTGIALLNAYSSGLLSKEEYQLIQKFKREKWDSVVDFLNAVSEKINSIDKEKESTNNAHSTDVEYANNVESTKNEESIYVESLNSRNNLTTGTYYETNSQIPVLASVYIKSNFTKFDNDVIDYLNSQQTPLEQSLYNRLYRLSVGWGRNYCRVSAETLMKSCNIKDRRTLNSGIDGLIEKGHIQIINRNNKGVLYKIFFAHEILGNENSANIEIIPMDKKSNKNQKDSTKNVDSTKNPPFKDIYKDSLSFKETEFLQKIINCFYKGIKQEKVTKEKRERAEVNIKKLLEEGFTPEEIQYAVTWTIENAREELYDFSIINHTIGQAKAAKIRLDEENNKNIEKDKIKAQQESEGKIMEEKIEKIKSYKKNLNRKDKEELRKKAEEEIKNSKKFNTALITDILIESKENEIIAEKLGIKIVEIT